MLGNLVDRNNGNPKDPLGKQWRQLDYIWPIWLELKEIFDGVVVRDIVIDWGQTQFKV